MPVTTLVTYYPKAGRDAELLSLVVRHWPVLRSLGLATETPARVWTGTDKRSGRAFIVELFEWMHSGASEIAHQTPDVMAVWETMGPMLADMSIALLQPVDTDE